MEFGITAIVQTICILPQFVMVWRGFRKPLPEGHTRIKRIKTVLSHFLFGLLLSAMLYWFFGYFGFAM